MKKSLCIILVIALIFALAICVHADEQNTVPRLSEASDEEIQAFLEEYGVEIPKFPVDETNYYNYWRDFILMVITTVEQDPDHNFAINFTVSLDFANAIKHAVCDYYGYDTMYGISTAEVYALVNSERYIGWSSSYANYNCYAFALGEIYYGLNPGDIGPGSLTSLDLDEIETLVVGDLEALNYQCVKVYSYFPSSRPSGTSTICLRIGSQDYHFMKLSGGSWYHKPSTTLPLRWRRTSPNSAIWSNERVVYDEDSGEYINYSPNIWYDSSIRYFVYKQEHSCTTTYGGEDYHSGNQHYYKIKNTCEHCGDIYYTWDVRDCDGPPCLGYMSLPIGEPEPETE